MTLAGIEEVQRLPHDDLFDLVAEQVVCMSSSWAAMRTMVFTRIQEVAVALVNHNQHRGLHVIDLSNPLHRACIYSILKPISDTFQAYLDDTAILVKQSPRMRDAYQYEMWCGLHNYQICHGFSLTHVEHFIEALMSQEMKF